MFFLFQVKQPGLKPPAIRSKEHLCRLPRSSNIMMGTFYLSRFNQSMKCGHLAEAAVIIKALSTHQLRFRHEPGRPPVDLARTSPSPERQIGASGQSKKRKRLERTVRENDQLVPQQFNWQFARTRKWIRPTCSKANFAFQGKPIWEVWVSLQSPGSERYVM